MGPKSYLQVPSETQENNRPPFEILESNGRFSSKNGRFCAYLGVFFPPRTLNICRKRLIWAPNLTYKFALR